MDIEQTLYFRYCRSLDGRLVPVDTARRNGRVVPRFDPEVLEPVDTDADSSDLAELIDEITKIADTVRKNGPMALESVQVDDPFLAQGIRYIADGFGGKLQLQLCPRQRVRIVLVRTRLSSEVVEMAKPGIGLIFGQPPGVILERCVNAQQASAIQ